MRLKKLNMSSETDKKILLTYFYKKLDTTIDEQELKSLSCICYSSKQQNVYAQTKRFIKELEPYKDKKILNNDVDNILQKSLSDCFRIQEELVRCDFSVNSGVDYFYIAVIGAEFFQIEKEFASTIKDATT